jgi:desulfoferrodoxin (superoxide reductase-like protein)
MKTKKIILILAIFFFLPIALSANKTSVEVTVLDTVEKGETVKITINVSHRGNSSRHHTDFVYLKINGKEVKRWEYSKANLPEGNEFIVEYEFEAEKTFEIEAKGNCNLHGSSGTVKRTIIVN